MKPIETAPRMTIGVYRISPDGTRTTVKTTRPVQTSREVPVSLGYPPCSCPRCAPPARRP